MALMQIKSRRGRPGRLCLRSETGAGLVAFALHALAQELAVAAYGLGLLAGAALGRLLVVAAELHLAEHPLALPLLLERAQRLAALLVADQDLPATRSPCPGLQTNTRRA